LNFSRRTADRARGFLKQQLLLFCLPHCLRLLRERYPDLRLALREDLTANLLLRMEDGQLDFALIALPYDTANLLVEPLFDDELWAIGRKGDPEMAVANGLTESPNLVARPTANPSLKRSIALVARRSTSRLTVLRTVADLIRSTNGANQAVVTD
jgi:DNA-binding transcriptional LysR family regulator